MKFYKDNKNNIYAYPADGTQDLYIKKELVSITKKEMEELRKPSQEQIIINNEATIKILKKEAINEITILKYEDDDAGKLALWEAYYAVLKSINTSVENMVLPEKPSN